MRVVNSMIFRAFADALEVIPYTLAEKAALNPIHIVADLRNRHALGYKYAGISIRKGTINDDIPTESVL